MSFYETLCRLEEKLLKPLHKRAIPGPVIIGGIAVILHGKIRPTSDFDLAVKTQDADTVIDIIYENGGYVASDGDKDTGTMYLYESAQKAKNGIERRKLPALRFVYPADPSGAGYVDGILQYRLLSTDTLIGDVWFMAPPGTTLLKLFKKAKLIKLGDVELHLADIEELISMKISAAKLRDDPADAAQDMADAKALQEILKQSTARQKGSRS